jgi:hypothetical protein
MSHMITVRVNQFKGIGLDRYASTVSPPVPKDKFVLEILVLGSKYQHQNECKTSLFPLFYMRDNIAISYHLENCGCGPSRGEKIWNHLG